MKVLKCKPLAQFAYNYTINVSSKCGNIISHRSLVFEGRHNTIDLRRSAHRSSIFESRHRSSEIEGGNIAPTTQHHADIPTIRHRIPHSRKFSRVKIFADSVDMDFCGLKFSRMATPMTTPSMCERCSLSVDSQEDAWHSSVWSTQLSSQFQPSAVASTSRTTLASKYPDPLPLLPS